MTKRHIAPFETRHFADPVTGAFLGSHAGTDADNPWPQGVAVATAPAHALQRWDGAAWQDTPALAALQVRRDLEASDARLARAVEDLIDALAARGALDPARDLPKPVTDLIAARKAARAALP